MHRMLYTISNYAIHSEQAPAGLQSKESFLAWNESYLPDASDEQSSSSINRMAKTESPVMVELPKTSSYLGKHSP